MKNVTEISCRRPGAYAKMKREGVTIVPHQQKIICTRSCDVLGSEILARIQLGNSKYYPPKMFLPGFSLSDHAELILAQLHFVASSRERMVAGYTSVNIIPSLLTSCYFPKICTLACNLVESGQPIIFELLETEPLPKDIAHLVDACCTLRQFGIKLYLDDYMTGYSAVTDCVRTPLDGVKVSRELLLLAEKSPSMLSQYQQVLHYIKTQCAVIVQEGVETKEQLEMVRECGVPQVQGYYFHRPELIGGAI